MMMIIISSFVSLLNGRCSVFSSGVWGGAREKPFIPALPGFMLVGTVATSAATFCEAILQGKSYVAVLNY